MDALWLSMRLLLLLAVANIAPIVLQRVLGTRWNRPVDGGLRCADGRPLLGRSKTWRGLAAAVLACAAAAPALGLPAHVGAAVGALAMAGDALSSFVKRRLDIAPGGRCSGLDQIPEALLPLLVLQAALGLTWPLAVAIALAFFALEIPLARWAHRHGLREQPH
ncbi:CDP-archaeol synthase [Rubrivivax sp. RP6-9]|uniref:CDP-archaeol synthase n=1 Tax=Rubrivivax sp. RP6-9 TaxID=3415750 RepID=UPI003CC606FA